MTADQRKVLDAMNEKAIGCFYHDPRRSWVWPRDVRDDPELATEILEVRGLEFGYRERQVDLIQFNANHGVQGHM